MNPQLIEALKLLVVGMVTVFAILLIVINMGKFLIAIVNKIAPEEEASPKKSAAAPAQAVDANTQAVIKAVVDKLTGGKGQVSNIQKI